MSFPRRSSLRSLATGLLAALVGIAPLAAQEDAGVHELLARSLAAETFDPQALRDDLEILASDEFAALYDALAEGTVHHEGRSWALDRGHEFVVLGVLARTPAALRTHLASLVERDTTVARREVGLAVLARCGTAADLPLAAQLAPRSPEQRIVEREIRAAFEQTCEAVLRRHPEQLQRLSALVPRAHASLVPGLLRRLSSSRSPERGSLLVGLLGSVEAADSLVLVELERVLADGSIRLDPSELRMLRSYLQRDDTALVCFAIGALVSVRDGEAVPQLVDLFGHPDGNLRLCAHAALVELTGVDLGWDFEAWSSWLANELEWWEEEAERYRKSIVAGDATLAAEAIHVIGRRALFRDRAIELLLAGLKREEPDLAALTCRVLGRKHGYRALPDLLECLDHTDASVRAAAHESLREITSLSLPNEPSLWQRKLSQR